MGHGYRGTSNGNSAGSSYARRARRRFLIAKFASPSGKTIPCHWCGKKMRTATSKRPLGVFQVDRLLCGHAGGTYKRDNVVPSCQKCNGGRCGNQHRPCKGRRVSP